MTYMQHLIDFIKLFSVSDVFSVIAAGYAIFFHYSGWLDKKINKIVDEIRKDTNQLKENSERHEKKMMKIEERWERQSREFDKKFWALYRELHKVDKEIDRVKITSSNP